MEVLPNHIYNMVAFKSEPELLITSEYEDNIELQSTFKSNDNFRTPQYQTSNPNQWPAEYGYYENNSCNIITNNQNDIESIVDDCAGTEQEQYEYKEPEENFISIDDLKVKPFLFDIMKPKQGDLEKSKENYESTVQDCSIGETDGEKEIILIDDDDDEEVDGNEMGEELEWIDLEKDVQTFECFLCRKKVSSNYNLRRHMMIHTGERPFGCDICLKKFREFSDLKKHRRVHCDDLHFKCMVCKRNTPSEHNSTKCTVCDKQDRHNRTNYGEIELADIPCIEGSQKKAFICPVCDRIFGSKHNLRRHFMIHTGEKPYKCDICEKCFREVSTLKKHMLTHSRIKLFKCVTCGKEYSDFGAYTRHKFTHSDKSCSSSNGQDGDKASDDGEVEYLFECAQCYKKFKEVAIYKDHLKLHSHDFSFQCFICKKMFRNKVKLNAHFVTHNYDESD